MFHDKAITIIKDTLLQREETIAVAESVTSGLFQAAMSTADDAIKFFQGGITAYNVGQKSRLLRIDPIHAIASNCVSQRMAADMALSVGKIFTSYWRVGITGYATAVPESDNKIYAYYAIACNNNILEQGMIEGEGKDAMKVQLHYVNTVLDKLAELVTKAP